MGEDVTKVIPASVIDIGESESQTHNVCQDTKPMADWLKEESAQCRPCLMGPVVDWYRSELEERGRGDLASELMKMVDEIQDTEEVVKVGEKMDLIKEAVGEGELRGRLKEFDCSVQMYSGEATTLPEEEGT